VERNPYSPPEAVVADVDEIQPIGRPFAAWATLIYFALSAFMRSLQVTAAFRGSISLSAAEFRFYRITGLPHGTAVFLSLIFSLLVFIQLNRLKRSAAYFATAVLAVSVFMWGCLVTGLEASEHATIVAFAFGCIVELLAVGYVWQLFRKGVLN
jgi:hypothetical protein